MGENGHMSENLNTNIFLKNSNTCKECLRHAGVEKVKMFSQGAITPP